MPANTEISHHYAEVGEVLMHYVVAGSGTPLVLLHGWPQTWYEWRHVIPALAERHTVIAPDLRGLGDTSRPPAGYDKRTVAADVWALVGGKLGHRRFHLVGHDWGGPTAYALAAAHRDAVMSLTLIDVVVPGDGGDFSQGGRRWHHQFHITPDLPEALIAGRERIYLEWFYRTFAFRPDAITAADVDEYVRTYAQPGAMRAGLGYYRAMEQDAADNRIAIAAGKLAMPTLGIGGATSYPHGRGRGREPEQSLMRVADHAEGLVIPECGHFVPEEQPRLLSEALLAFLAR